MKIYSVKEIADLLDTNPETVRRWIRSGRLSAVQESRKDGNSVSEFELSKFLKATPKYASIVGKSLLGTQNVLSTAVGGLIGTLMIEYLKNQDQTKNTFVQPDEILKYLIETIASHESSIKRKKRTIEMLEQEITEEQLRIQVLQKTIEMVKQKED